MAIKLQVDEHRDTLVKHYEDCFEKHGDTCKGVDWPNEEDAAVRYTVMEQLMTDCVDTTLLDYGCGLAGLVDWYKSTGFEMPRYTGYDPSAKMIEVCRKKHPDEVFTSDEKMLCDGMAGYVIMNGLFTVKRTLTNMEMRELMHETLQKVWPLANVGIAFNVMSKSVDKEREDLFHMDMQDLSNYLCKHLSRNFVIRNDYGLHEYTAYVYR